jgi:hypothetical protein
MKRITLAVLALSFICLTAIIGCKKTEQAQPAQEEQTQPADAAKEAPADKK